MRYADVIVPLAVEGVFTYTVGGSLFGKVREGMLVLVPFAGNKQYTALVVRLHDRKPEGYEVKAIEAIADGQVFFTSLHLNFLLWLSEYYMSTPGEVLKAVLPVMFRLESHTVIAKTENVIDEATLTPNERSLLVFLHTGEYIALKDAEKYSGVKNILPVVKSLLSKGYVQLKETVDDLFQEKKVQVITWSKKFEEEDLTKVLDSLKNAPAQYKMLCRWIETEKMEMERSSFLELSGCSAAVLKSLCAKGILTLEERVKSRLEGDDESVEEVHDLSAGQSAALSAIRNGFLEKECVLLKGVTSSGKTEIYIHLIEEYLRKGKQVLYMLPEIALTVQIVRRLRRVFGNRVGIYHSGMSDQMRVELWRRQCSDTPFDLILGVRSSVFLPFNRLGLVIVDEEHDASYKQKEPAPRYNGRDAAIMLARMAGGKVLLGSATPSFESFHNAREGKYVLVELNERFGGMQMPEISLVDLKELRFKKRMSGSFSPLLIEEIRKTLAARKQVILFQNRRGYSSYVQCDTCGIIPKCRHCDVSLTYYKKRNVLICRYCGSLIPLSEHCSHCNTGHYKERIPGTERIEEEIGHLFPDSRAVRMDLDTVNSKERFRRLIDDFEKGRTDILIGTQMVTKGLDFENVRLVGVMDADCMTGYPDFRAEERAFCMLQQVSGRSGRHGERGKVIIQTANKNQQIFELLLHGEYNDLYESLLSERRLFGYPPFGRLIQVEIRHKDVVVLRHAANHLGNHLREKLGNRVCGPAEPEVGRIGGMYRLILLLKLENKISFSGVKMFLKSEMNLLKHNKAWNGLWIFCDVDP